MPIITNIECRERYQIRGYTYPIPKHMLCAAFQNGNRDHCHGDSGGPLSVKMFNGRYVQAGIVSWGSNCGQDSNRPGVYTRVTAFMDWIKKNTNYE